MAFCLTEDRRVPLESLTNGRLRRLYEYWDRKRGGRAMPSRADIDPLEMREHLSRMHLLDVLGPYLFRYRVYGSGVTNPNMKDMTRRTTQDYEDTVFGALVTRHYQTCADEKAPVYHEVFGTLAGAPYEYIRLTLPQSSDGVDVDMLLVSSHRVQVSISLPTRDTPSDT